MTFPLLEKSELPFTVFNILKPTCFRILTPVIFSANSVIADPQKSVNIIENVFFAENVFIVNFNGEDAGFFAYSPSSDYDRDLTDGSSLCAQKFRRSIWDGLSNLRP